MHEIRDENGRSLTFFQVVEKFNITELAKVSLRSPSLKSFEVLDVSDVHIPRRTGVEGGRESRRKLTRVLALNNSPGTKQPSRVS